METKAVVPRQPRGERKVKNELAQGKNRQVLRDIGNLETLQGAEGKISRPMTRSFHAQLLANVQVAAEKNKLVVIGDGMAAITEERIVKKAVEPQKRVTDNAKDEDVIVISSDEEEDNAKKVEAQNKLSEKPKPNNMIPICNVEADKVKPVGGRNSREQSSRRVKTLTSIITARSKAACGITNKPKDLRVNIDAADVNNELAVVEYVDDIYKFYKLTEDESQVHDYMISQPNINAKMRSILVDWLIDVHNRFELMPETLYLTVNILDRYLSMKTVTRRELQLVGISSMLIACKYEEIWAPQVYDLICISDDAYVGGEICIMEKAILEELEWYLTVPTPYVFLIRYVKASGLHDEEMEKLVFFLAELGIINYSTIICYCPSMLAAAAVYAARCTLNKSPLWTETLKHHTGYCERQLKECAKLLVSFHSAAVTECKIGGVYRKYLSLKQGGVALLNPAKNLIA